MRIMVEKPIRFIGAVLIVGSVTLPAAAEEGNVFTNLFKYGGTTVPPSQPADNEPAYCPSVDVFEGGSNLRTMAGANVRTQTTLGRVARECTKRANGSVTVKVGVEARVLLGPSGSPGRFEVPATVIIKHDEKVVATKSDRTTAVVEPGEAQGFAQLIIDDLVVPPGMAGDYEIEVGLGGRSAGKPAKAKAKGKPRRPKPTEAAAPDGGGEPAQ
jgi:hypothetical protein